METILVYESRDSDKVVMIVPVICIPSDLHVMYENNIIYTFYVNPYGGITAEDIWGNERVFFI